ncbi:MAG: serine dehydratase [Gammaproteobacteria bacterium]|jgi:threonine dehydratase|nr:serine dehydratase [Gammaproteobacteria bacterium]|tara:strand:- start:1992 stop:2933 length:942 start_codon:yes stop_codon:yes gene_type:complete
MKFNKEDIILSHKRIASWIHNTPVLTSTSINQISGADLFFKCENFQKIGAFKMRGALNAVLSTSKEKSKKGFVTHSSGNHAQAVALSSKIAKTKAYIVMPNGAPKIKIKAVKGYGAEVTLCDNNEQSRVDTCEKIIKQTGANFIHPYDNDKVILGQSTCSKELYDEVDNLDYIIPPVGGGGLASGTILSTLFFSKSTKVILAEPEKANDAYVSFNNKKLIPVSNPDTIADGLKTSLSKKTFDIIMEGADEIITINEGEIINAMRMIWERLKIVCEPSCSLPLAAVLKNKKMFKNKRVGLILTGGNIDLNNLPF